MLAWIFNSNLFHFAENVVLKAVLQGGILLVLRLNYECLYIDFLLLAGESEKSF